MDIYDVVTSSTRFGQLIGRKRPVVEKKTISILGLFELTKKRGRKTNSTNEDVSSRYERRAEGYSEMTAAQLAINHVNKRGINGGYQLKLYTNDTKCDPGVAVDTFFHAIFTRTTRVPILLGTACSEATSSLANIVPYWNIVQISHGATSPVLSHRKEFPLFFRVVAPESTHNNAILNFIRHFGWHTITTLSQNEEEYSLAVNDLLTELELANIKLGATLTFGDDDLHDQLQVLKVYEFGMFGSDYAWIIQLSPEDLKLQNWIAQNQCARTKLHAAIHGLIMVSSFNEDMIGETSYSVYTNENLKKYLKKQSLAIGKFSKHSYDAVWTAAIALNQSIEFWKSVNSNTTIEKFDYHRQDIAQEILERIEMLKFRGITGPISFDGPDRIGITAFHQLQGNNITRIALYDPETNVLNFNCTSCQEIVWEGGQVPISQRYFKRRIETIETTAFITIASCTCFAILIAILFLAFNLYFRKLKYIKLSSPKLNNITVVGCIAVYIGVLLLGLDHATFPNTSYFPIICTAKVYFFAAGFSLAFGSIFAKTYRIHKIFIRCQGGVIKKKFLQDTQLILLICVLLLIDGLILTLWVVFDPMERQLHNLTVELSTMDRSVMYQPQVEICSCVHLQNWLIAIYIYKGLQLVMGLYMAWETRHVKVPALNDSQYIGMSVYTVVITSCIVVVLANLISERPTVAYTTISTMILFSTTVTLCLLFFPKLIALLTRSYNCDPVMHSMGLKIESNTRRFVVEDNKEKIYRLEVQNRVYKREAMNLKTEIKRLERQLNQSGSHTNSASSIESGTRANPEIVLEKAPEKSPSPRLAPVFFNSKHLRSPTPRSSWPSETYEGRKLNRSISFHCETELEIHEQKLTVIERLINLIGSKNHHKKESSSPKIYSIELIDMPEELEEKEEKRFRSRNTKVDFEDIKQCRNERLRKKLPREKRRGSPRFPHKIVPTSSLSALVEANRNDKSSNDIEDCDSRLGEKCRSLGDTRVGTEDI